MLNDYRPLARNRDFLVSLAGRCASRFGDEVAIVALTLRVQAAGGRPYLVALLLAAGLVPSIAAAGLAGRVADSADSRRVLVLATAAQACCCVPLIFTHQVAAMIVLVALLGTGAAFSQATWQALIPRVAGEEHIGAATALQQAAFTLSTILAPAVAGILAGAFGTGVPLALDAVTFGVMTVAALAVRTRRGGAAGRAAPPGRAGRRLGGAAPRPAALPADRGPGRVRAARHDGQRGRRLPGPADPARQRRVVRRAGGDHDDRPGRRRAGLRADQHRRGARPGGGRRRGPDVAGHAGIRHRAGGARARPAGPARRGGQRDGERVRGHAGDDADRGTDAGPGGGGAGRRPQRRPRWPRSRPAAPWRRCWLHGRSTCWPAGWAAWSRSCWRRGPERGWARRTDISFAGEQSRA